ncbi:MAG: hypothetical protein ACR2JT_02185 [Nocardioidaceae bacterium]
MSAEPLIGGRKRLFLHVGLHKTGTTFLQATFRANRHQLADQGVHFPGGTEEQPVQRLAIQDLLGVRPVGARDRRTAGHWQALVDLIEASTATTVLVSEETLGPAAPRHARRAVGSFPGREVHVLVTARDLGRVLPSFWQETLKNDNTWTWSEFVASVRDPASTRTTAGLGYWRRQDLPVLLGTWAAVVPPERLHLVVVPPSGSPPTLLLDRFATVIGFDPARLTEPAPRINESLTVAGAEVVRRLSAELGGQLNQRQYDAVVKRVVTRRLADRDTSPKLVLPESDYEWAAAEARRVVEAVRSMRLDVVGDLEELIPVAPGAERRPDDASPQELVDAAILALSGLAERYAQLWWARHEDDEPTLTTPSRRVLAASTMRGLVFRGRRKAARLAEHSRLTAPAVSAYVRVRHTYRRRAHR